MERKVTEQRTRPDPEMEEAMVPRRAWPVALSCVSRKLKNLPFPLVFLPEKFSVKLLAKEMLFNKDGSMELPIFGKHRASQIGFWPSFGLTI